MAIGVDILRAGIRSRPERKVVPTFQVAHVSEAAKHLHGTHAWIDIDGTSHINGQEADLSSLAAVTAGLIRFSARIPLSEDNLLAKTARVVGRVSRRNTESFPFIIPSFQRQAETYTTGPSIYGLQKLLPAPLQRKAWREATSVLDQGGHIIFIGNSWPDSRFAKAAHRRSERTGSGKVTFIYVKP